MKKIILFALLIIIANAFFSQQTIPAPTLTNQDYLKKSKNKKKIALIMLGGGATLILTGMIFPKGEVIHESFWGPDYKNDGMKGDLYFFGALSMLGSIPFFISSHHNKKMAAAISFKNEPVPLINKNNLVYHSIPTLNIKIKL